MSKFILSSSHEILFDSHAQTSVDQGILFASGTSSYSTFLTTFAEGKQSVLDALNAAGSGGSREKQVVTVTGSAITVVQFKSLDGFQAVAPAQLDVYLNGQLMQSGTSVATGDGDYSVTANSPNAVTFTFNVEADDVVQAIKP